MSDKNYRQKKEYKQKMSDSLKKAYKEGRKLKPIGNKYRLGSHITDKQKIKYCRSMRKYWQNPEWKKKISKTWLKKGEHAHLETEFKNGIHININEKNPMWQGGKSFEPYGSEFNKQLKEQIRKRDNYRCQQCFRHQDELRTKTNRPYKLYIHHIDFNKTNNNPINLISLCLNCHAQTNFNRGSWITYFQERLNQESGRIKNPLI